MRFRRVGTTAVLLLALAGCRQPVTDTANPEPSEAPSESAEPSAEPTTTGPSPSASTTTSAKPSSSKTPGPIILPSISSPSPSASVPNVPSLFASERAGITASQITLCAHVPLTGAAPIARAPSQTNVYWSWLNDQGGVNGRKVRSIVYDDTYRPEGAISAAEKCRSQHNAFLVSGAAGVDQITAVASWAKRNKVPYLHGSASKTAIGANKYQFFMAPDYENQSLMLADYVVKVLGKKKVAIVRLDSPHFVAASKIFRDRVRALGGTIVADITVTNDQQTFPYSSQLSGAEVINNFTNPLTWTKMVLQLGPVISPLWVAISPVAALNLIPNALGAYLADRAHVFSGTPAFRDDTTLPYYSEVDRFLDAFTKYTGKPRSNADDVDWIAWLLNEQIGRALKAGGRDITRTKVVNALQSLKESTATATPACPLDFLRDPASPNRIGAWSVNVFRSSPGKWNQIRTCRSSF